MISIVWDVDDVLNDLMHCWLDNKWLPEHLDCQVTFEQITQNTSEQIINASKEEYLLSLDNFRLSKAYFEMKPNPEILAWFKKYGEKARHVALTSVPIKAAHISANWVMKNFGRWIRSFNFIPSSRAGEQIPEYDCSKADYLKWLNKIDVLVEDNEQNIREAEKLGIKGILVRRPWNKSNLTLKDALVEINKIIMKE